MLGDAATESIGEARNPRAALYSEYVAAGYPQVYKLKLKFKHKGESIAVNYHTAGLTQHEAPVGFFVRDRLIPIRYLPNRPRWVLVNLPRLVEKQTKNAGQVLSAGIILAAFITFGMVLCFRAIFFG